MMPEYERYELHLQFMHETVLQLLSRGIERTTKIPQNGYRRRIYFEGMARLGEELSLVASMAAFLVRNAGEDLRGL